MEPPQSSTIVTKKKLRELIQQVDPSEKVDVDVEDILLDLADDFIHSVTKSACQLAKHRQSDTLEVRDLQLHLESMYNIRIPGFATDDVKPTRRTQISATHTQRLNQVRKAMATDAAEREKHRALLNQRNQ